MPGKEQPRKLRTFALLALIGLACFGVMAAIASSHPAQAPREIAYSDFLDRLADGDIETARISPATSTITGQIKGRDKQGHKQQFRTAYPPTDNVSEKLDFHEVPFLVDTSKHTNPSWLILLGVVGIIVVLILLNRSRSTAAKASAGAPGRMMEAGDVPVTFKDVAGVDEVVNELSEIKQFLSDPERFRVMGANIPKGVLLFGPPGTGKTLLARAVAGEAGVPFFSISGSDFVEMYVGVGASRVRKLFEAAKAQAPCVVFIDEIDAVGRRRSGSAQGGQEERENTLNQLLVEIDGFAPTDNVIVMAASNRADILDPALTRPGRFDRQVIVDSPDRKGRLEILKVHGKGKPFGESVGLDTIAAQTAGFNGADLANLVNEAALLAARDSRDQITAHDMDEAMMRVIAGPQKNRIIGDSEKRTIAAHEIGHAIVAHEIPECEPVHKVTIIGRGRALGMMVSLQEDDKLLRTRSELMGRMAVALGGRVAEEIMFDDITTGAQNDLEKVNEIAQAMVLTLGMSDQFALRSFVHEEQLVVHSNQLRARIDAEIDAIVGEAKLVAQNILLDKRDQLEALTVELVDRETIEREEFEALMRGETLPPLEIVVEDQGETSDQPDNVTELRPDNDVTNEAPGQGDDHDEGEDDGKQRNLRVA
jgi:cell division protease FtsH